VNPYEIMLLLDAELAEERQAEIITRIRELVAQRCGTWQCGGFRPRRPFPLASRPRARRASARPPRRPQRPSRRRSSIEQMFDSRS
jgi:hypothetical protein